MRHLNVELVLAAGAEVAEGPCWDTKTQRLAWVDIHPGELHLLDPYSGQDEVTVVGSHLGAAVPRQGGGWVLAVRSGFAALGPQDSAVQPLASPLADLPLVRMNDGKCDAAGRFWAGSMSYDGTPGLGQLFRLDLDGTLAVALSDVSLSNGLDWSPDGRTLYYVDTPTGGVDAFDFDLDDGRLSGRRRVVDTGGLPGDPDGLTVDEHGAVWVAAFGGSQVRRYTPAGELDTIVTLPTSQVTCCAFGGLQLDELYITTATFGLSAASRDEQPLAGGVFVVRPGVSGRPPNRFAG